MKNRFSKIAALLLSASAGPLMAQDLASPLQLDARSLREAGIVTERLAPRRLSEELRAPGEVKADAYSTELVTPRVDSIVLSRKAKLGDVVKAGQPLLILSSVQVAETQGALIVAEQEWQRVAALGPQAVSGRRYAEVRVQRDQASARLRAYGLSEGQIRGVLRAGSAGADGSYALLAPTDGRIASDQFLVGERVEPGRTLFTLVKEDSVWIEAQLPAADAARAKAGGDARILAHGVELPGQVLQRAHRTDERTRTVPVRIQVDNRRDLLHPGELVDVRLDTKATTAVLAVPMEAVVLLQNQATVFVARPGQAFEPTPVVTGEQRGDWVTIKDGLKVGTEYVSRGAFELKARLLRSQLGEE